MDVSLLIKQRLGQLNLDQRDLAAAVQVTESYISQLLTRKKAPPAPGRTDIYEKIGDFLKLGRGELSRLAEVQRREELKKRVAGTPVPLFKKCRELILRKCNPENRRELGRLFDKEPFGELERLVTQTLLDVAQRVAKEELRSEEWLRAMAELSGRSYEEMRVAILEFLDTEVFNISVESCVAFLDPIIDSWSIDIKTFGMDVVLNNRLAPGSVKRFEFAEQEQQRPAVAQPGFEQFLKDRSLSGGASDEEIEFLRALKFSGRRPTPLYYYRELQNLRDPLHFTSAPPPPEQAKASD
ncbi:MAG TPA: helix-turn-helix transcriptional regulator [Bryobacteraceae bacterium]